MKCLLAMLNLLHINHDTALNDYIYLYIITSCKKLFAGSHNMILPHCTHIVSHLFSTLKKAVFLQPLGSGWFPNKCHNRNPSLPLSFPLWYF